MIIKRFMTEHVHSITLEMTVRQTIEKLMSHHVHGAPVVDNNNRVISMISEGDLLKLAAAKFLDKKIANCLEHLPKTENLISLSMNNTFIEVYRLFLNHSVHRIVIMDANGRLQGIVSRNNVLKILLKSGKDAVGSEDAA